MEDDFTNYDFEEEEFQEEEQEEQPFQRGDAPLQEDKDNINSLLNELLDPTVIIDNFEHTLRGEVYVDGKWIKRRNALAGTGFINKARMTLNTIINKNSIITQFTSQNDIQELYLILVENIAIFIDACIEEPTLRDENFMAVVEAYTNAVEFYVKHLHGGKTADLIKQLMIGVYRVIEEKKDKKEGKFSLFNRS